MVPEPSRLFIVRDESSSWRGRSKNWPACSLLRYRAKRIAEILHPLAGGVIGPVAKLRQANFLEPVATTEKNDRRQLLRITNRRPEAALLLSCRALLGSLK